MSRNEYITAHWPGEERLEKMKMDDIEELLESIRIVYASLEKLHQLDGPEFLLPGRIDAYHSLLEEAYAAFGRIETRVDALGQQLKDEHQRLDKGVKKYG